ncbi:uncharacterized protein LODBEIA_P52140 [Lodderomyces beijingensis]|uniref:Protein PXR1 n=1 Tax=Lodderomyces beijingensis TaxID=1775926 RepID=A0ABP0ZS69_9ASCO
MGLAGTKVKQRFGLDPRNTNWSNNDTQFGHKYLSKMGWRPGSGLGLVPDAVTTHVKVHIKTDNSGLGARLQKADADKDLDECSGLDAFQRILGRLNGKEDKVNRMMDLKRKDEIIGGKWGVRFVKGETLSSTWDRENRKLLSCGNGKKREGEVGEADVSRKKRKRSRSGDPEKEVSSGGEEHAAVDMPADDNSDKKEKKEKREKKSKSEKKVKSKKEPKEKSDKKVKKEKKHKRSKHSASESDTTTTEERATSSPTLYISDLDSSSTRESTPTPIASRLSARSKWIKQKRASVMDAKALNEIFMISK